MQNPHKFFIGKHTVLNGDKIACMSRGVGALDNPDLDYTYVYYAGSMEPDRLYGTFALDVWDWYVNFAKYHNLNATF